jgi:hypothetical protein
MSGARTLRRWTYSAELRIAEEIIIGFIVALPFDRCTKVQRIGCVGEAK